MEMDSLDALTHVVSEAWLAHFLQTFVVWNCASLMELPEECVEVDDCARVIDEGVPVTADTAGGIELRDDFLEVPWEGKHVGVLLLVELLVRTHSLVYGEI